MSSDPWPGEWLRGVLDVCVLAVLAEGSTYGYAITARLDELGLGAVKGGTLYPLLVRLEQADLVTTQWRPGVGGPGRKYFALTAAGAPSSPAAAAAWRALRRPDGRDRRPPTPTAAALPSAVDRLPTPRRTPMTDTPATVPTSPRAGATSSSSPCGCATSPARGSARSWRRSTSSARTAASTPRRPSATPADVRREPHGQRRAAPGPRCATTSADRSGSGRLRRAAWSSWRAVADDGPDLAMTGGWLLGLAVVLVGSVLTVRVLGSTSPGRWRGLAAAGRRHRGDPRRGRGARAAARHDRSRRCPTAGRRGRRGRSCWSVTRSSGPCGRRRQPTRTW